MEFLGKHTAWTWNLNNLLINLVISLIRRNLRIVLEGRKRGNQNIQIYREFICGAFCILSHNRTFVCFIIKRCCGKGKVILHKLAYRDKMHKHISSIDTHAKTYDCSCTGRSICSLSLECMLILIVQYTCPSFLQVKRKKNFR